MAKLTDKQKLFVDEYLIDLNATQAAIRAGYSEKTAYRTGADNLRKPQIQSYIQEAMKEREKRTEITQDKVLKELASIGFANATDFARVVEKMVMRKIIGAEGKEIGEEPYYYKDVELELTENLDKDKQAAIASIKQGANGIEVKLNDKVKALELIGKHLGMFVDKTEVSGDIGLKVVVDYGED